MNSEITNAVHAADQKAQYDACVKRLLGNKIILAHILVHTVEEFHGMDPQAVISSIEGEPYISCTPVEPGLTNHACGQNGERIIGFNTENAEINEGFVIFDIVTYVWMRDGLTKFIINVEAQKEEPGGYAILNRAIFYVSRLISSQKERDFQGSSYDDIKQVYSIWVCMNMKENALSHYHLMRDDIIGSYDWKGNLDLFNIIMIGLSEELPEQNEDRKLHRLLGVLLSEKMKAEEKLNIIGTEYNIPIKGELRKEVGVMCNLSEGIEERGIKKGIEKGITIGEARGREEGEALLGRLIKLLLGEGRTVDIDRASTDPEARQQLYREFHLI